MHYEVKLPHEILFCINVNDKNLIFLVWCVLWGKLKCYFRDLFTSMVADWLVYKCSCYNATYYGKTKRHFKVRTCPNYLDISHLTGNWQQLEIDNNTLTAIQEHLLCWNYSPSFEDFSILFWESKDFKLKIMEKLLIVRDKPVLNKADSSLSLDLF